MTKVKYYYDPDTLSYRKIKPKKSETYKKTFIGIMGVLLIAFFGFIVFSQFLMSPNERAQRRELENLRLHYELLNKRIKEGSQILEELQKRDNYIYRTYFEANPIPDEQRKAGFGGVNRYKNLEGFDNSEMVKNVTKDLDILSKQMVVQSKSLDEIVSLAKAKEKMLASIPAIQPIKNQDLKRMASGFGMRMHPILKSRRMHNGMDFTAPTGTQIYASGNGTVIKAARSSTFGNVVYIDHGYGYKTIYAHMSKIVARKGQKVKRGDLIGYVGNTGRSAAPHLHYEVHKNGRPVNPIYYYYGDLTPEEFLAMQKASQEKGQSYD
ncbi:M23 family metallopeptidase [Tenacibaculum maritimum]|uniref:M23 family metallopeptidase n=1 Tax=Tenacibaculum maritimum TaxID=107401 RepID=UPI000405044A|nr:M23 family metallopeptidase [Tenacibaculum maritimum]MCD9563183.1 M23 family metallopeptidase [Tenacibaculum maritimum]MCD9566446.1 M23 family metallopeptidase [Tenacibaculum maritimum]MCD9579821.1 M23 family metallopeptidase [Tenacibaculum maritimum]MCD9582024.1 M23 family metallopeptidase [Tenacibaculum maritimum]MCD9585572.1 M23 family metallopeptidase [Tenacibaculum maritimum]